MGFDAEREKRIIEANKYMRVYFGGGKLKMLKLVETKIQRFILLIGGLLILLRLSGVNYYQTYKAVLQSIGIAVFTVVLLTLFKDYKPEFHHKIWYFIRRHRRLLITLCIVILIFLVASFVRYEYLKFLINQQRVVEGEIFHQSEVAYQNCLDKVASQSHLTNSGTGGGVFGGLFRYRTVNKYFDEWINAGWPYYDQQKGHWEMSFMKWMMENHRDFCSEFDPVQITSFVQNKLTEINNMPISQFSHFNF